MRPSTLRMVWVFGAVLAFAVVLIGCGGGGDTNSKPSTTAPQITLQPQNLTVTTGQTATLMVAASGNPTPSFQWERSNNAGANWGPVMGGTSATFVLSVIQSSDNGTQFRAKATNIAGTATSNTVVLTVQPHTGIFIPSGSMASTRSQHTATLLPNGQVLMAGGRGGDGWCGAEIFNPDAGSFTGTISMQLRRSHTGTLLPSGKVLLTGGEVPDLLVWSASAELFDPVAGTFATTGSMGAGRGLHSATLLSNGKVLIAGGLSNGNPLAGELYDPVTGSFSSTGSMSVARGWAGAATLLLNGKVLFTGGYDGSSHLSSAELYDPATGTFTPTGSMVIARTAHTATLLKTGRVLISGGVSIDGYVRSAELYDPITGTFTPTGGLVRARVDHSATLLPNGDVLIAGGFGESAFLGYHNSAELYDPVAGVFTETGYMTVPRSYHTGTLLPNGKVLIAGGHSDSGPSFLARVELYQ